MKAHWLNDGETVLVTGTLDPAEAKDFLLHKAGEPDMVDFIEDTPGQPQRGIIYPCNAAAQECSGYAWMWKLKDNGRVKAVVFE